MGKLIPIRDHILVEDMHFGEQRTKSGIIIRSDDGKDHGIKPRWAKVYAVGPEQKHINPGEWVLVEHGRWTRGFNFENENGLKITLRKVDNKCILLVSDKKPEDVYVGIN
jgi:hypothetical protein